MEPEARQNPLSKNKTIEQLRTTIDKLETIIEQLDSTSVVNLPSSKTVEALITTTEALENAISNLPSEAVTADSESTPISEVVEDRSEVTPIPLEEQQTVVQSEISASQTPATELSENNSPKPIEPIATKNVAKSVTKTPAKSNKKKKKKNWIPIAIIALIVAIIPISLKYFSPGITPKIFSEKTEEIIEKTIIAEPPTIASNLPDDNLQKNEALSSNVEDQEPLVAINTNTINNQIAREDTTRIAESLQQQEIAEKIEKPTTNLIREEVIEIDGEKSSPQEEPQSQVAIKTEIENPITNQELAIIIASDDSKLPEIVELETTSSSEPPLNIEDKKITLEIDKTPKEKIESENLIVFPENLGTEITEQPLELKTVVQDIKLTPEQNLITILSDKVLALSENYQDDLVLSIKPNIANNILSVKIADAWYQLESTKQDQIVADLFARSQELEFRKLEIKDQNDNLVARSPVVGQKMIIFRRDS